MTEHNTGHESEIQNLQGANVLDSSGEKVGSVGQIYLDDESGRPSWVTVKTGFFGNNETFIPLKGVDTGAGRDLQVPYTKDVIKDAPNVDAEHHITPEEEQELYRYYSGHGWNQQGRGTAGTSGQQHTGTAAAGTAAAGTAAAGTAGYAAASERGRDQADLERGRQTETGRGYADASERGTTGTAAAGTGTAAAGTQRGTTGDDDSVVRHEERLNVGKETVESGRVRLRKHVVTEQKTMTVPVQREEVSLERQQLSGDRPATGYTIGEGKDEVHEVTLHEERPVVSKETVEAERVGLHKNVVEEQRQVSANVAHEEVEAEQVDGGRTSGQGDTRGQSGRGNA